MPAAAGRQRPLHPGSAPPGEGLLCVARLGDRRWSSRVPPARVSEALRLGNTQAITRCGEPLQLHEPMQIQSWVGIFAQNHTERRAIAGPGAFDGLCDDEGVPLICPTCQVLAQSVLAGDACYFAWGCFRYFWLGATATRRGCENPA